MDDKKYGLKPAEKFGLTIDEASAYFEIGQKKLRQLVELHQDDGICTRNGTKTIILRPNFEKFLMDTAEI